MDGEPVLDLEDILENLGIGKYQYYMLTLFGIVIAYSNITSFSFVFTAADIDYRCKLSNCVNDVENYQIQQAFPLESNNLLYKCVQYSLKSEFFSNATLNCTKEMFDQYVIVDCNEWTFSRKETSILSDFDLACDQEKLSFVGTLNSIGVLIGLPISGIFADRYGRRLALVLGCLLNSIFGVVRSYSGSYYTFLILEFFSSAVSCGIFPSAFMLGMEFVSSTKRPLSGAVISSFNPLGAIIMGATMWWLRDWRLMLRVMYFPGFLFIFYMWYVELDADKFVGNASLMNAFGSKELLFRVILCSFCWIVIMLVYYGLSITSVDLPISNKYVSFIVSNFMEIPACIVTLPILEMYSRKGSQSTLFCLSSLSCILCVLIPNDVAWLIFILNMTSKFLISIMSCTIYVYTAEIFPTEQRLLLHGLCSTVGRLGSILAPQMPILKIYFGENSPVIVFAVVCLIGAILVLLLPETKDIKLPDTIKEVEQPGSGGYHIIP